MLCQRKTSTRAILHRRASHLRRPTRLRMSLSNVACKLGIKETGLVREALLLSFAMGTFKMLPLVCKNMHRTCEERFVKGHKGTEVDDQEEVPYEDSLFGVMEKPMQAAVIVAASARFLRYTSISRIIYEQLMDVPGCFVADTHLIRVCYLVCFVWLALRGKNAIISRATARVLRKFESSVDRRAALQAIKNLGALLTAIIAIITAITLSEILNISITRAWAGLGFTGVAAGLAAKDTAANVIGGLLINLTKPFQVGQYINVGGVTGEVLEIGSMKTRLMTAKERHEVVMPNSHFLNNVVTNLSSLPVQNLEAEFGVDGANLEKMPQVCTRIYEMLVSHPLVDVEGLEPYCNVKDITLACPVITLRCVLKRPCKTPAVFARTKEEILFKVREILGEYNIDFAYPKAKY